MDRPTDDEIFEWLEKEARLSRTGISFDYIGAVDGEPSGWRFMRRHFISDPKKSIKEAIIAAMYHFEGHPRL